MATLEDILEERFSSEREAIQKLNQKLDSLQTSTDFEVKNIRDNTLILRITGRNLEQVNKMQQKYRLGNANGVNRRSAYGTLEAWKQYQDIPLETIRQIIQDNKKQGEEVHKGGDEESGETDSESGRSDSGFSGTTWMLAAAVVLGGVVLWRR